MFLKEEVVEIDNPKIIIWNVILNTILKKVKIDSDQIVKINLVKSSFSKLYFHLIYMKDSRFKTFINNPYRSNIKISNQNTIKDISVLVIPTGIGASIGGYAGDANPLANAFSKTNKYLLTNPNVVNGAVFSNPPENMIYLEGYFLNQFLMGQCGLNLNYKNKIGVIFDKSIKSSRLDYEINVLNATKAFYGADIVGYSITNKPLNVKIKVNKLGFSSGEIQNIDSLIEKAKFLKRKGATTLAICTKIKDSNLNPKYISGSGIDPIGGIESILSHIVSAYTGLVCAHAPVLASGEKTNHKTISPLASAEYVADTFLPSVINGLRYAPEISKIESKNNKTYKNISSIVLPYTGFGSPGVMAIGNHLRSVYLIKSNETCLKVNPNHFNMKFNIKRSYLDFLNKSALSESKTSPSSLSRPVQAVKELIS